MRYLICLLAVLAALLSGCASILYAEVLQQEACMAMVEVRDTAAL